MALVLTAGLAFAQLPPSAEPKVNFSFDQVELPVLIKLVGEMTGRHFVVGDEVAGRVTVVTPERIPVREAYPLLLSILESRGYSVVEEGGVHHVIALPERALPPSRLAPGGRALSGDEGLITRVIAVQHVNVAELRRILEPLVRGAKAGALVAFPPTNHLLITDTAENVRKIERIVAELDRPGASRVVEVVELRHGDPDELARQLVAAMKAGTTVGERIQRHLQQVGEGVTALPADVVVVAVPRARALVLVGTPLQLKEMRHIVARLDVPAPSGYGRLHAIFLKYLSAEEAAKSLNALFAKADKEQRGTVAIEPNPANNALIVDASPQDFEFVRSLIEQLDQIPQQVMVEVLVAEVAVGRQLDLGVRLSTIEQPKAGESVAIGTSRPGEADALRQFVEQGVFPQGLAIGIARGTFTDPRTGATVPNLPLLIEALARSRDVKILSNVPLWAQNNSEASVSVVDNIPILRSTIEGGSGTARDIIQNIDRVDVGIKLKFTPHVNPDGDITLRLNPSIEAIVDRGPADKPFAPTIAKREVSTTVTVPNGATVVISGLIREDRVQGVNKVPLLGDLPLIGFFFRSKSERTQRTNLLIFVTPHIVTDMKAAQELRARLQEQSAMPPSSLEVQPAALPR